MKFVRLHCMLLLISFLCFLPIKAVIMSCLMSLFIQGGPAPTLIKAEIPWSARRGNLSERDGVLKTVKG